MEIIQHLTKYETTSNELLNNHSGDLLPSMSPSAVFSKTHSVFTFIIVVLALDTASSAFLLGNGPCCTMKDGGQTGETTPFLERATPIKKSWLWLGTELPANGFSSDSNLYQ